MSRDILRIFRVKRQRKAGDQILVVTMGHSTTRERAAQDKGHSNAVSQSLGFKYMSMSVPTVG